MLAVAAETATARLPDPEDESDPSVTAITADSDLNNTIAAVATPLVKVSEVDEPKVVPATVGAVTGFADELAPLKVTAFAPV